jgi:hypothetical protein
MQALAPTHFQDVWYIILENMTFNDMLKLRSCIIIHKDLIRAMGLIIHKRIGRKYKLKTLLRKMNRAPMCTKCFKITKCNIQHDYYHLCRGCSYSCGKIVRFLPNRRLIGGYDILKICVECPWGHEEVKIKRGITRYICKGNNMCSIDDITPIFGNSYFTNNIMDIMSVNQWYNNNFITMADDEMNRFKMLTYDEKVMHVKPPNMKRKRTHESFQVNKRRCIQ